MKIDGACHCGLISYEAEIDPANVAICNCTDCQALSGTAFRVVVPTQESDLKLSGEPKIYIKTTSDSGAPREQAFCPNCGSSIYATSVGGEDRLLMIRAGTLKQFDQLTPSRQIWTQHKHGWLDSLADLPGLETQP